MATVCSGIEFSSSCFGRPQSNACSATSWLGRNDLEPDYGDHRDVGRFSFSGRRPAHERRRVRIDRKGIVEVLDKHEKAYHAGSEGCYGNPRIWKDLVEEGEAVSASASSA
jgi:hypothetical protein